MSKLHFRAYFMLVAILLVNRSLAAGTGLNGLGMSISNYTAHPSESFCVAVSVNDFTQIVSTQYSIQWDAAILQFDGISDINLPHSENLQFNTSQTGAGIITALWFDSEGEGNDLADATVIYRLCFTATGPAGSDTDITFENTPVNIEITNIPDGGTNIGIMSENGHVSIIEDLFISNSDLMFTDCADPQGGAVNLTVIGGQAPLSYSWTGPGSFTADTEDIFNLETGDYHISITDASNPPLTLADSFFIDVDLVLPLAEANVPGLFTCKDTILVLDGNNSSTGPEFQYQWITIEGNILSGDSTLNPTINAPGIYQLIITDTTNGCSSTASATVLADTITPIADAGPGGQIDCYGITAILYGMGSSTGNGISAFWTTPDGSILTGENAFIATANAAGTYLITVVDSINGCLASSETLVTIDTIPPIADAGTDRMQTCIDEIISLDGSNSSQGAPYSFLWSTNNGNITFGENLVTPQVNQPGTYELLVQNDENGCTASSIVYIELDPSLVDAYAGEDEHLCEDSFLLFADEPESNTGQWSAINSGHIAFPEENISLVENLQTGSNLFAWTLSTEACINYASDTIELFVEGSPRAVEDDFRFPFGSTSLELDLTLNDDLDLISDWQVFILEEPAVGVLTELNNGFFDYSVPQRFSGPVTFSYFICNDSCLELCDSASVRILIDEEVLIDTSVDLPNAFTPNGDGMNDTFVFPELINNPGLYPENELIVFNRWGDIVYRARPYWNDWNGENGSGQSLPAGTYYYVLKLDISNGKLFDGDVTILKE